ncbi:transposase [Escherichia coli]|uniref:Transposase n=1 Tax=Escherichia coli TaxID=562 RepID=A0A8S0G610_ECOLX|nr:transposase [Escherichia coli]
MASTAWLRKYKRRTQSVTDVGHKPVIPAYSCQDKLKDDPMSGHVFIFRGRSGSQVKLLWSTGDGLCLLTKRLERGRFAWPSARDGKVFLTQAQLAMLLEGIDWRQPKRLLTSLTML